MELQVGKERSDSDRLKRRPNWIRDSKVQNKIVYKPSLLTTV
ncbi:hypothetical protein AWRI1631_153830 [Saccharomyces cerevisiae AWRI1631]|uniref:Uncharacterized protein n=1 Tax=Saccharomyces cerevisiae (strain AWRI1631) TaxID=545124 RepID=B5VSB5_YEAS6|nr:hypothetical protein AWRI1631_153830 [Saccharomyces cerevisiae AWRI1631]